MCVAAYSRADFFLLTTETIIFHNILSAGYYTGLINHLQAADIVHILVLQIQNQKYQQYSFLIYYFYNVFLLILQHQTRLLAILLFLRCYQL